MKSWSDVKLRTTMNGNIEDIPPLDRATQVMLWCGKAFKELHRLGMVEGAWIVSTDRGDRLLQHMEVVPTDAEIAALARETVKVDNKQELVCICELLAMYRDGELNLADEIRGA
jgi:hypothetical protein